VPLQHLKEAPLSNSPLRRCSYDKAITERDFHMLVTKTGAGLPLLLIHGLGSTSRAWAPVLAALAAEREVWALDLPGHGGARAEDDSDSFVGLARSLEAYLDAEGLTGVDMVGSSLGGQLVLEMARRGKAGATVALDPGGFWLGWERTALKSSLTTSLWTVRCIKSTLPMLAERAVSRSLMLALLSARPWSRREAGRFRTRCICRCDDIGCAHPRSGFWTVANRPRITRLGASNDRLGAPRQIVQSRPGCASRGSLSRGTISLVRK